MLDDSDIQALEKELTQDDANVLDILGELLRSRIDTAHV